MSDTISEVLLRALDHHKAVDLARVAGTSKYAIYRRINEEATLRDEQFVRLARYLAEHGDFGLVRLTLPPSYDITPVMEARSNGRIDDEITDLVTAASEVVEGFRERNTSRMDDAIIALREVLARMEAEKTRIKP